MARQILKVNQLLLAKLYKNNFSRLFYKIEFIEGISQFSVKGDKEAKLKCKNEISKASIIIKIYFLKVAFKVYDMDRDGFISNSELFLVLKMMVGSNLKDTQLQQIVDKTIINADKDGDGKISYEGKSFKGKKHQNID